MNNPVRWNDPTGLFAEDAHFMDCPNSGGNRVNIILLIPESPASNGLVFGRGITIMAGVGGGFVSQWAIVIDTSGNVGLMNFSVGGATLPTVSATIDGFVVWEAATIFDLGMIFGAGYDQFYISDVFSGTIGTSIDTPIPPVSVGGNLIFCGNGRITGSGVSVGASHGLPVSPYAMIGFTSVLPIGNINTPIDFIVNNTPDAIGRFFERFR